MLILLAACRKQAGGECHIPTCQFATSTIHFVSGTITWSATVTFSLELAQTASNFVVEAPAPC